METGTPGDYKSRDVSNEFRKGKNQRLFKLVKEKSGKKLGYSKFRLVKMSWLYDNQVTKQLAKSMSR